MAPYTWGSLVYDLHDLSEVAHFGSHRDHPGYAFSHAALDNGLAILVVFFHFQVAVGVDEHGIL